MLLWHRVFAGQELCGLLEDSCSLPSLAMNLNRGKVKISPIDT